MEAFSLLKYWRGGGGVAVSGGLPGGLPRATTIVTAVPRSNPDTDDDDDDDGDDGPFFDLEFSLTDEEVEEKRNEAECENDIYSDEENDDAVESFDADEEDKREFNFTLTSGSNSNTNDDDQTEPNVVLSPCDEKLFFKGRLVPVESNSVDSSKPQFAVTSSLLKSATKIRVFLLGFKKSKANTPATDETSNDKPNENVNLEEVPPKKTTSNVNKQSKFFTVKLNVEEVPLVSMFTRENSKSVKTTTSSQKPCDKSEPCVVLGDEKQRFSKDVMQKYLKKVKPLYVRVSKRYGEKLRFSGQLSFKTAEEKGPMVVAEVAEDTAVGGGVKSVKQGDGLPAGLRVVYKHLGKSRSASSAAVAAAPSPPETVASRRRDDSLLQQQDGIQGAILHCKRSFNASRVRDPSHEKSTDLSSRKSSDTEPKKAGKV